MKELTKLKKKYNKINELEKELKTDLSHLIGTKVRPSKECVKWYMEHGEECGIPFNLLLLIKERKNGVITNISYSGYLEGFDTTVNFGDEDLIFDINHLDQL